MTNIKSSNLGYPRIGEKREWKRALESFWKGDITESELLEKTTAIRLDNLKKQQQLGIDLIPVGDFSLYDHILDTSASFGIIPKRYDYKGGEVDINTYYQLVRGSDDVIASEMTKWFNTNYHYIVPELNEQQPELKINRALKYYNEAKDKLGINGKPVLVGPITYVSLAKGYQKDELSEIINQFTPLYVQILKELAEAGATWVQIDEPIFSTNVSEELVTIAENVYQTIAKEVPEIKVIFQTYFERLFHYERLSKLPVAALGLDFIHGESLELLQKYGFPEDKYLAAGVIDGRNVWRADLQEKSKLIDQLRTYVKDDQLIIQPSSSLLHVPVTKKLETKIDPVILGGLSFADEKLTEINLLTQVANHEKAIDQEEITESTKALEALKEKYRSNDSVAVEISKLTEEDAQRDVGFKERLARQKDALGLPVLPTTTIGSLPQTKEVKQTRSKWRRGDITNEAYDEFVKEQIAKWIKIQEDLDLDVLVHGEFERNDMVEYFGEKFNGFLVTEYGWVQSYGSRCVKPPLIFGDVDWSEPITVKESVYAQSLTDRHVKGMLTGPVTILNWSFVHDATPRTEIMKQIALALRKEVEALESAGIKIIQVDEPALREGLPLDTAKWDDYLTSAAYAFRLATASVQAETQIHTHMCYSNFEDIFESIDALDADVISIETSRSHGELVSTFEENTYEKEIGLGVYDIHSPRVPAIEEINENIDRALQTITPDNFWVNPDCGLKTRDEQETIDALKVMVEAAKIARDKVTIKQ